MKIKEFIRDYFRFSRRDRIGLVVLLVILAAVFFLPVVLPTSPGKSNTPADTSWTAAARRLEQHHPSDKLAERNDVSSPYYRYDHTDYQQNKGRQGELFYFNPNTLDAPGWQRLGLREKTIHTIQNYLAKGGRFRKPEDLKRIYGLFPDEYARLEPYIQLTPENTGQTSKPAESSFTGTSPKKLAPFDINSADTTRLIALPGIGSKLASRIISFRDKLGGFYSVSQVGETYGLPDSTFQKIRTFLQVDPGQIRKIDINSATIDELKAHPYIRWTLANPIIAYRNGHGPFSRSEDLKKVMVITDEVYEKIAPYILVK